MPATNSSHNEQLKSRDDPHPLLTDGDFGLHFNSLIREFGLKRGVFISELARLQWHHRKAREDGRFYISDSTLAALWKVSRASIYRFFLYFEREGYVDHIQPAGNGDKYYYKVDLDKLAKLDGNIILSTGTDVVRVNECSGAQRPCAPPHGGSAPPRTDVGLHTEVLEKDLEKEKTSSSQNARGEEKSPKKDYKNGKDSPSFDEVRALLRIGEEEGTVIKESTVKEDIKVLVKFMSANPNVDKGFLIDHLRAPIRKAKEKGKWENLGKLLNTQFVVDDLIKAQSKLRTEEKKRVEDMQKERSRKQSIEKDRAIRASTPGFHPDNIYLYRGAHFTSHTSSTYDGELFIELYPANSEEEYSDELQKEFDKNPDGLFIRFTDLIIHKRGGV